MFIYRKDQPTPTPRQLALSLAMVVICLTVFVGGIALIANWLR